MEEPPMHRGETVTFTLYDASGEPVWKHEAPVVAPEREPRTTS